MTNMSNIPVGLGGTYHDFYVYISAPIICQLKSHSWAVAEAIIPTKPSETNSTCLLKCDSDAGYGSWWEIFSADTSNCTDCNCCKYINVGWWVNPHWDVFFQNSLSCSMLNSPPTMTSIFPHVPLLSNATTMHAGRFSSWNGRCCRVLPVALVCRYSFLTGHLCWQ